MDMNAPSASGDDGEDNKSDRRSLAYRIYSQAATCCDTIATAGYSKGVMSDDNDVVYYEDTFNDQPWRCSIGTEERDGTWMNYRDQVGAIMSSTVWVLVGYSCLTITLLAEHNHLRNNVAMGYCTICAMALACHAKTTFTDPGSIPKEAVPPPILFKQGITTHAMCSHCQTYKPPTSHHCRICNRCISRMDHHCPWMNNCVGAGNLKHFVLFLCYTWTGCTYALIVFAVNYFGCTDEQCEFTFLLMQLVRVMSAICLFTLLFTSSMLMNVTFGIMTGVGTIDRLKKKADNTVHKADEEPMELKDIFGVQGYWTWPFPIDPIFEDHDRVMGYTMPDRLMREKARDEHR